MEIEKNTMEKQGEAGMRRDSQFFHTKPRKSVIEIQGVNGENFAKYRKNKKALHTTWTFIPGHPQANSQLVTIIIKQ